MSSTSSSVPLWARFSPRSPISSTIQPSAHSRVLEEKGHLRHEEHGLRYVYFPAIPRDVARRSALRHLVETFFDGSVENVVTALLGGEVSQISSQDLNRLARLIPKAGLSQKGAPPNNSNKGPKIDLKKKDLRKNERTF